MAIAETKFSVLEVISVACSIFRTNGYIKKADVAFGSVVAGKEPVEKLKANSQLIYSHFFNPDIWSADVTENDKTFAEEIIHYLKGLSFKTMERKLTDFESNVLKFITSESVGKSSLGIAASLPQVYKHKLDQDKWQERESELAGTSEFLGGLKSRSDFEVTVENIRFINRTGSHLYCTSVGGKHILKFFSDTKIAEVGEKVCLSGYVKSHAVSNYHGGKETMINRLKIHVTNPEKI